MRYVTREEFRKEMDELKEHINKMMDHKDKEKEKMSSEEVSLAVTEVLNEEAQLKEELSKPASAPIKHNPEEEKTVSRFKFAQNRNKSTLDRVMETISNK